MELRKLLRETTGKSIIVIEDIDCLLDITIKHRKKTNAVKEEDGDSKVTLPGLLKFIDSLWSACGDERIIILTTNYKKKLDAALMRRGRIDMHIEMSYCTFEAFKVLAKNYLDLDIHELFGSIQTLLEEVHMIPADVAQCLMVKNYRDMDINACLQNLIEVINLAIEEEEAMKKKMAEEAAVKAKEEPTKEEQ